MSILWIDIEQDGVHEHDFVPVKITAVKDAGICLEIKTETKSVQMLLATDLVYEIAAALKGLMD